MRTKVPTTAHSFCSRRTSGSNASSDFDAAAARSSPYSVSAASNFSIRIMSSPAGEIVIFSVYMGSRTSRAAAIQTFSPVSVVLDEKVMMSPVEAWKTSSSVVEIVCFECFRERVKFERCGVTDKSSSSLEEEDEKLSTNVLLLPSSSFRARPGDRGSKESVSE